MFLTAGSNIFVKFRQESCNSQPTLYCAVSVWPRDVWRALCTCRVQLLRDTKCMAVRKQIIIIIIITYLLQLSCHSVAVVLTLVQTKQIRINVHKRNNTKTQYEQYKNTISTLITKIPTQLSKHPHITKPTRYKTS